MVNSQSGPEASQWLISKLFGSMFLYLVDTELQIGQPYASTAVLQSVSEKEETKTMMIFGMC